MVEQVVYDDTDQDDNTRLLAGLTYSFGGSAQYNKLFADENGKNRPDMRLDDARPVA